MREFSSKSKSLFTGFLLLTALIAVGQQTSRHFQHLTTEEGLPQNMVDCMLQDSHGFMWFGTWNGLCRYDGYTFELFDGDFQSSNKLRSNFIQDLKEDRFGNIWIGTREGLHVYRYNDGTFIDYADMFPGKIVPNVKSIFFTEDSTLYIGTNLGLTKISVLDQYGNVEALDQWTFGNGPKDIAATTINDVYQDSYSNLWIGTDQGLYRLNDKGLHRFASDPNDERSLSFDHVLVIYQRKDGELWIGTEVGLNRFNYSDQNFVRIMNNPRDPNTLPHNTVMDILEGTSGKLYFATLGGFCERSNKTGHFINNQNMINDEHSLSNDFVNCLMEDRDGNIWIGTERGGVNFFNADQNQIEHFTHQTDNPNSLSARTVNSIYEDEAFIWIGTAGGGLNRYNKATGNFQHYSFELSDPGAIASDFVTAIQRDQKGRLWVATWGGGVDLFDESTGRFIHYQSADHPEIASNYVSSIIQGKHDDLWIGTLRGLVRYDLKKDRFVRHFNGGNGINISQVGCMMLDDASNLWVGTRIGLYKVRFKSPDYSQYQVMKYIHETDEPASISGDYIISMTQDSKDQLWFGTYGQGLNLFRESGDSVWFEHITSKDGLSNSIIYGIEEDSKGFLWTSTDYGLSRINTETRNIRNFYVADGFLNNQYYWSASHKNAEGKLYFGGMEGLDAFYPKNINRELTSPEVIITDVKLLNESVVPGVAYNGVEVMSKNAIDTDHIELSFEEKVIGMEFSALNFQDPGLIRYAYILEGFENEWNYVSANRRYASYTNLKPGDYTFKVKASSTNGQFLSAPKVITIHIAPPFWQTMWFRAILVLGLVAMIIGYTRYRTYSLKRQKQLLEKQVAERTERINHQNEALSFQAIQLRNSNNELEEKQKLIEGQNQQLEHQNKEILSQRDELISLNKKLKLVSQLKLSFFTNISHEFRTPLTLILGPLEKLIKEHDWDYEVKNTLNIMHRNGQRLLHLINQVMDFRKIEKGRMELRVNKVDISGFMKSLFRAFQPLADIKTIQFDYQERNLPPKVWLDTEKLENIIYNLLSNAFKYTPKDGKVKLEVKGLSLEDSKLDASDLEDQDRSAIISIRVADSGIGISEENLPLIFKRFYRIESEEAFRISGSGIGLALTEELVKTHHGKIFVESHLGEGSVFEVQFPCLKGAYGAESRNSSTDETNILKQIEVLKSEFLVPEGVDTQEEKVIDRDKATVLVVEDSNDLRTFITHRLSKNYNILEADNGVVALQLAEKHTPDIVISDVMMPKMDGLELCAHLKGSLGTSHIPVILLTSKSAIEDQLEGLQIGADDYLPKPFNFDLLEAKIQNFIDTRKKLRHLFVQSSEFNVDEATTNSKDQKFLEKAIEVVGMNLERSDFGVKEFVELMGISRSLLHKKLTGLTDQSAAEFINHLRMKKALSLLKEQNKNISEIAYAVGYNDPKYFSRLFSKHFGKPPKEYLASTTV